MLSERFMQPVAAHHRKSWLSTAAKPSNANDSLMNITFQEQAPNTISKNHNPEFHVNETFIE